MRRRVEFARKIEQHLVQHSAVPSVSVLFSGGVDCAVLAAILDRVLPPDVPIDLVNVAFDNERVRKAAAKEGAGAKAPRAAKRGGRRRVPRGGEGEDASRGGGDGSDGVRQRDARGADDHPQQSSSSADSRGDSHEARVESVSLSAYRVPDRITGEATLDELRALAPKREWRFVPVCLMHTLVVQGRLFTRCVPFRVSLA